MTLFSNKFKKLWFWPNLGAKKLFLENLALSRTTSSGFLAPYQNLEKVNHTLQKKRLDIWTEGWKDGQILFYKTLQATTTGPKRIQFLKIQLYSIKIKPSILLRNIFKILCIRVPYVCISPIMRNLKYSTLDSASTGKTLKFRRNIRIRTD